MPFWLGFSRFLPKGRCLPRQSKTICTVYLYIRLVDLRFLIAVFGKHFRLDFSQCEDALVTYRFKKKDEHRMVRI